MGKRVVLVEAGRHLGGMSVEGLGGTDIADREGWPRLERGGGVRIVAGSRLDPLRHPLWLPRAEGRRMHQPAHADLPVVARQAFGLEPVRCRNP
jgi:hypothetical protein